MIQTFMQFLESDESMAELRKRIEDLKLRRKQSQDAASTTPPISGQTYGGGSLAPSMPQTDEIAPMNQDVANWLARATNQTNARKAGTELQQQARTNIGMIGYQPKSEPILGAELVALGKTPWNNEQVYYGGPRTSQVDAPSIYPYVYVGSPPSGKVVRNLNHRN